MARFHVNPSTGGVGKCSATLGGCPYGGEDGLANHYGTQKEAMGRAEELMAAEFGSRAFSSMTKEEAISHRAVAKRAKAYVKARTKNELRKSAQQVLDESRSLRPEAIRAIESEKRTQEILARLTEKNRAERSKNIAAKLKHDREQADSISYRNDRDRFLAARERVARLDPEHREALDALAHNRRVREELNGYAAEKEAAETSDRRDQQLRETAAGSRLMLQQKAQRAMTEQELSLSPEARQRVLQEHYYAAEEELLVNQRRSAAIAARAEAAESGSASASSDRKGAFAKFLGR